MPYIEKLKENGVFDIYDYGKTERKNRKLGHITLTNNVRASLMKKINEISDIIF